VILNGLSVVRVVILLSPVVLTIRLPDPVPLLQPHYGPSSLLRTSPPQCPASVLSPRGFGRLCFSLAIRALVPAVPRESLCPTHALFAPVAVCPVIRLLADLSQRNFAPLVLATIRFLTTRHRWVHFRSSFGHSPAQGLASSFCSNAHHHSSLPQQLGVVWDPLPKADPEGPSLIFHAALRRFSQPPFIRLCSTPKPRNLKVSGLLTSFCRQ
jgi:hypothetical protein